MPAPVAPPPSPLKPALPVPATVVMTPVPAVTRWMRLFPLSAMKRLPPPSTATPLGKLRTTEVSAVSNPMNVSEVNVSVRGGGGGGTSSTKG